jgi:hypothetical protein
MRTGAPAPQLRNVRNRPSGQSVYEVHTQVHTVWWASVDGGRHAGIFECDGMPVKWALVGAGGH